jgi:hypothetical protein
VRNWERAGITLLEVTVAITFLAVLVTLTLYLYGKELTLAEDARVRAELNFALQRGGRTVSMALLTAEEAYWQEGELYIRGRPGAETVTEVYFIADKDHNGVTDLYRERGGSPSPLVSHLTHLKCVRRGVLWEVELRAALAGQELSWHTQVRQGGFIEP